MDQRNAAKIDIEGPAIIRNEQRLVWLLCVLAAVRVFFFCAAFPFFNNTDEQAHFDLVLKYSHGHPPRGMENFSPESIRYLALCSSPEFFLGPEHFPDRHFPPPVGRESPEALSQAEQVWSNVVNAEAWQPPLYYAVGGLWLKLGQGFGFGGAHLLYWLRFLNVLSAAALVWLSFLAAREFFPAQAGLRLGVPVLTAFLPQDMFYGIGNDTLSPLCFGAAFIFLIRWLRVEVPSVPLALCLGLTLSATYLTKVSNVPLLAIACFTLALRFVFTIRSGNLRRAFPALGTLLVCIVVPIGAWMMWMQYSFGDATGSAAHIQLSGWTRQPFAEWWQHPIFTWRGGSTFVSELIASFWRGEFIWHGKRLTSGLMDLFYIASSLMLVALAAADLPRLNRKDKATARIVFLTFLLLVASVAFLVLISIRFDFGDDFYPSRASPYLWSGRLISGALIPFVILYVYGLGRALSWTGKKWVPFAAAAMIAIAMTISEIHVTSQVFASAYNWFHMP
jgi:hypothetical protein